MKCHPPAPSHCAQQLAHYRTSVEHPGLAVVGDYLFDSTLNGVLRSASIATQLLLEAMSIEPAELLATV